MGAALAATLVAAALPFAQSRPASTLEPALIARVNQIYPGFTEILEVCEPISLERLSRVLSENPGRDSLAVLLAVLESCPAWSASDWSGNRSLSRLGTVVRTVGELPLAPVARMLRTGTLDQRTMAAALFGGFSNLVPVGDRGALEQAFIAALSDPDMHVRELIVGRLRLLGPGPAGQAAIDRSVADPNASRTVPVAGDADRQRRRSGETRPAGAASDGRASEAGRSSRRGSAGGRCRLPRTASVAHEALRTRPGACHCRNERPSARSQCECSDGGSLRVVTLGCARCRAARDRVSE